MRLGVAAALAGDRIVPGDVEVEDGRVVAVGRPPASGAGGGGLAVPGFVDLQVNGFAGVDFATADAAGYRRAGAALLEAGTTAFRPTLVSAPEPAVAAALAEVPDGLAAGPRCLGAHLEGPFLAPGRAGAHDPECLRAPDAELLARLLDVGPVRHVTLAPELPGALELVDLLVARGLTVAAGHTDATAADAQRAFDRGVSTVTHLHNAMAPGTPREPGLATVALSRADVTVQVIVDGQHLADETVLVAWRAARRRFALVTDAVAAAGAPDGDYELGGRRVVFADGAVRTPGGRLAGSAITMADAVRNLHALGVPLVDALSAATAVPAAIARRPELGVLAPGAAADVVVLDDRLEVRRVLVAGETVAAR